MRPACLWQSYQVPEPAGWGTGWGQTEWAGTQSDDLLKVKLDFLRPEICKKAIDDTEVVFTRNQLCAGILSGGKDTCQGGESVQLQKISGLHTSFFFRFRRSTSNILPRQQMHLQHYWHHFIWCRLRS